MPAEKEPNKYHLEVKEFFSAKQTSMELFADILLAELKNDWTMTKQDDIIKSPTVKS